MRSLRPRPFLWYEDAMLLAEDEAIERKKLRKKESKKTMKKSIPLCKPFLACFSGLDIQEELERWEREGIVKYVLNTCHDGYVSSVTLGPNDELQDMIINGETLMKALVFETYHEDLLAQIRQRYPQARYEQLPNFKKRGDIKLKKKEELENLDRLFDVIDKEAERRELDAAHAGERGDYGASILRDQVRFFRLGMKGEIPAEWEKYEQLLDPEYAEWQRLNKKFGGRT